jgi:hypothetical protein
VAALALTAIAAAWAPPPLGAQGCGCGTVRGNPSLPLRAGSVGLEPGQMVLHYQWNYSRADHIYDGKDRLLDDERTMRVVNVLDEHTVGLELGAYERLSFIVEVPFQVNNRGITLPDGRIEQTAADLADIRAVFRYWVLPADLIPGNVAIEAGLKAPTGDKSQSENFGSTGRFHNDVSVLTGTGSWDGIFGTAVFLRFGYVVPFAGVRYLLTPAEDTGSQAFHPELAGIDEDNSIPDQLTWRVGIAGDVGRAVREAVSTEELPIVDSLRVITAVIGAHVPTHDLIGGSGGFRRSFDAVFIEPGIEWGLTEKLTLNASVPVTLYRYFRDSPGTFPEVQVNVGLSFQIN